MNFSVSPTFVGGVKVIIGRILQPGEIPDLHAAESSAGVWWVFVKRRIRERIL
jgi:hypothetical protein